MERRGFVGIALVMLVALAVLWLVEEDPVEFDEQLRAVQRRSAGAADDTTRVDTPSTDARATEPAALASPTAAADTADDDVADDEPPTEHSTAALSGRVLDPDGAPLPGVRVTYVPPWDQRAQFPGTDRTPFDLEQLPRTLTDAGGRFALEPRWWDTGRSGERWSDAPDVLLEHPDHAVTTAPAAGFSSAGLDLGDLRLVRGAWVTGRVLDEFGAPLPGVEVGTFVRAVQLPDDRVPYRGSLEMALRARTDASGRFRSAGLQPGSVILEIEHPGYTRRWITSLDGVDTLWPERGATLDVGDIALDRGLALAGVIVDTQGAPVADAEVVVSARDMLEAFEGFTPRDGLPWEFDAARERNDSAVGRSDAHGRFALRGLEPGSVALYARAEGYEFGKLAGLAAGGRDVELTLRPAAVIELELLDADTRAPLRDVEIEAVRHAFQTQLPLAVVARVDGLHEVIGVGPHELHLALHAPGHASGVTRLRGLAAGERRHETLTLPREAVLTGRVVDELGAPLRGVNLWAARVDEDGAILLAEPPPPDDGPARVSPGDAFTASGADGRFRLDGLHPSALRLHVELYQSGRVMTKLDLELEPGEQRDLGDLVYPLGAQLDVFVRERDGAPVVASYVSADPVSAGTRSGAAETDAAGAVHLRGLVPGDYLLHTARVDPTPVTLRAGETAEVVLTARARPRLFGRVTRGGAPLQGARVFVREERDRPIWGRMIAERTAHTGAAGEYELELPGAEPFFVRVSSPADTVLQSRHDFAWDEQRRLDFAFDGAALGGTVRAADDGSPLENVGIEARPVADGGVLQRAVTRSDAAGHWRFDELSPGAYTLRAWDPAFAFLDAGPVHTGRDDVALVLQPGAVLHGTLTRPGVEIVPDDTPLRLEHLDGVELRDREGEAETEAGAYRFERLPAGRYRLLVGAPDAALLETTVELAAGEQRRLDLTLPS